MHLLSVRLKEKYRTLPKDLTIEFRPLTLLVGEQGCGKSSLLDLLQKNSQKIEIEMSDYVLKNSINSFYFDSEKMNPRTADHISSYTNPDGTSKGIGMGNALSSHFKSHGETLKEFTVNRIHQAKDCVLLMDEPESALSLRNQYKLAQEINDVINKNVQVIMSTHCLPLIESVKYVYSLEHHRWMRSKEFINLSSI